MAPWYRFMIEAKCNDEWFNIDHWCRRANGTMAHQFLLAASERDLFSCDYDELVHVKSRLFFHENKPMHAYHLNDSALHEHLLEYYRNRI